jgi:hypothetical protein
MIELATRTVSYVANSRGFASAASAWVLAQRAGFALVGGVVLAQLTRVLFERLQRADVLTTGKPPILGVLCLVVVLVWCAIIIWARLRIGQALNGWARGWVARFPVADTTPRRYAIEDRGGRLASGLCAVLDLIVLLLVQDTIREPLLLVTSSYTSPAWAEGAFTAVVVVLALLILSSAYRTSRPVAAYLTWSAMDRLVPTAGFLAGGAVPAVAPARTGSQPALSEPARSQEPAPRSAPTHQEPTVVADQPAVADEVTVRAPATSQEATIVAPEKQSVADERTVRAPAADPEQTAISERHRDSKGNQQP